MLRVLTLIGRSGLEYKTYSEDGKLWWICHKMFGWHYVYIASSPSGMPSHHQVQRVNRDRDGRPFAYHFSTVVHLDEDQPSYEITPLTFPNLEWVVRVSSSQSGKSD